MTEQQRRPTLVDVAQAAGVSRALFVSIVMRGAPGAAEVTRQKVLQPHGNLATRPASRVASQQPDQVAGPEFLQLPAIPC